MSKRRAKNWSASAALLFAALGDQTRIELLQRLSDAGPLSISVLAETFSITRQGITKHLNVLADAGVIEGRPVGRQHLWALNPARLAEGLEWLGVIGRGWDDALGRLKAQLEEES